jgi:hypothetical protein
MDVTLSLADAAALDAVLDGEAGADGAREQRVRAWLKTIEGVAVPAPSEKLADRTLAAVRRERLKIAPEAETVRPAGRRWRLRVSEIAAMATAAAILVAVLIPGIAQARQSARRVACAGNLAVCSTAFETYAAANGHELPALAMPSDGNWLGTAGGAATGQGNGARSNADNLLPLVTAGYLTADRLACPGRGKPAVGMAAGATTIPDGFRGYSYTNLVANPRQRWDGSHNTLVLADRNPLFDREAGGATPNRNSWNHGSHGTYVLAADGAAVAWELTPNVGPGGDNIWTLGSREAPVLVYAGTERATTPDDAFLAP